jgi:hypothetical protein
MRAPLWMRTAMETVMQKPLELTANFHLERRNRLRMLYSELREWNQARLDRKKLIAALSALDFRTLEDIGADKFMLWACQGSPTYRPYSLVVRLSSVGRKIETLCDEVKSGRFISSSFLAAEWRRCWSGVARPRWTGRLRDLGLSLFA